MKRKHFILALVAMLLSFVPPAFAQVAKVGNTEYATIDEAIAAWTNNTTLTLLSDVTLSDVVTLNSTEHHILNLGTYTMTAASGKNAIVIKACGTGDSERTAITIKADATNPGGINAGSKCVVYYKYADGGISGNDRPIIKIEGGVFTGSTSSWGTAGIYTIGKEARKCATLNISGGTFNCSINGSTKSKLIISGGVFNYSVGSQGDSTALRLISGGTFKTFGFMTADSNNTKFWFGTSMANSNVGVYVDDNGYIVVGGAVVTEAGDKFEASSTNYSGASNLLQYSSAKDNGLYYTSVKEALADNNTTSGMVTVYADELDMTGISYKGTIVVPEGNDITITNAPSTLKVQLADGTVLTPDANNTVATKFEVATLAELQAALASTTNVPIVITEQIEIPAGETVELDLNGKTVNSAFNGTSTTNHIYALSNKGTLTIQDSKGNGSINSRGIYNYGSLTLNAGAINAIDGNGGYAVNNQSGSTFVMNGGVVAATNEDDHQSSSGGYDATALKVPAGCTAILNGGTINNVCDFTYAIDAAGTLNIPETSTITVNGTHGAIYVSGGETTINAGTYTILKDNYSRTDNVLYVSGGSLVVNGGTFIGDSDTAGGGSCLYDAAGKAVVNGGTFKGSSGGDVWGATGTTIKGGKFENLTETKHIAPGYELKDGTVVEKKVAEINGVKYATLAAAVAAVKEGETITLIDNVVLAERVTIPADKTLTIDLNGKSISMEESIIATAYAINNLGNLTITDGVGGGSINARGVYNGYGDGAANVATAKIIVLSGTINAKGTNGGAAIFNYGVADIQGGNFTSIGGYSLNNQSGASMTIAAGVTANNGIYASGATLVVNGGEINGNRSGCHVLYAWNSNVTIAGGTFHNNNAGNATVFASGSSVITIEDGTFSIDNGKQTFGWTSCMLDANAGGKYVIKGGEFKGHFRVQANSSMEINGGTFENTHNEAYNIIGTAEVKGGTFTDAAAQTFAKNNIADDYKLGEDGKVVYVPVVAKIGETKYETLDAAFAAATEEQTITLMADATPALKSQRAITKAAVIDLGGKTMTLTEDDLYFGTTTFKNGTIVVDPSVKPSTAVFWMFANQTLTFDNVQVVATGVTGTYLIGLEGDNSDLNLLNGSKILVENTTALDLDIICVNGTNTCDIKVENSKVNVTNLDGRVFFRGNYTVKDSEVNLAGITKAGFRIEAGQKLSIEGTSKVNIEGEPRDGGIHMTDLSATYTKAETATVNATVNEPKVAKVGENTYRTLAQAVAAVEDGGTITLIANETFTKNNRYNNGGWWDGLGYSGDKSFTIDLANFTISQDGALNDYLMWFKNDGAKGNTITLKNGTLDAGTTAYSALATSSSNAQKITVNLENINVINNNSNGAALKIRGGSELNVKAGTIITGQNSYLGIETVGKTTVVNIYEGAEIYQNGTSSYCGCLAGVSGNGTINVYGGKGQSKSGGFIAMTSGGTINIEGGEWTANTDGTYANGNKSVLVAQSDKGAKSIVNVTGGTFKGGYNCYGNKVGDAQINISGGNFNAEPTSYVAEDYIAVENNGVWNVEKAAAKIGATAYATLAEAIKAAKAGDVVTVFAGTYKVPTMKAGITIEGEGNVLFEGTLTGTLENLTMKNIHIKGGNAQRWAYAKGDLVFENVTFEATSVYALHFDGITEGATLLYKNCTIIGWAALGGSPDSCVFEGCTIKDNGTYGVIRTYFDTEIKNCTFDVANAKTDDVYQDGIHAVGSAKVVVNDCTNKNGEMKDLVNVSGASVVTVDSVEIKNVAKIGETYYETLAEAIKAAKAGDVVTVFAGTYAVPTMKAGITIEGEVDSKGKSTVLLEGTLSGTLENITLKNLHIKGGNAQRWAYAKGNLVFENVTFEATSVYALHFDGITEGATLTYKNCTIIGWAAMSGSPANCTFEGCTFKGNGTYGVIRTYFDATITGCTFDVANVNTTDNYQDGIHAVSGAEVTVTNCTNANGDMKEIVNVSGASSVVTVNGVEIKNVAKIGETYYTTLQAALAAAQNGQTVTLIWAEGNAPIAMNGSVFGKNVTITGTAKVDWSKGFLFVGRGGEGDATVTFDGANLTSASNSASYGIHVSGREKNTNNKYDGTLIIKNSTIELDYLINKGAMTLDNATLTVKNGTAIGGRPASETESGADATATISLANNSKLIVNNHNGMGLGYEAIGVMNIDATSTFETTQSFLVTTKGTMNIAGKATIAGTLTNNGSIVLTTADAELTSTECGNVTTNVANMVVSYSDGKYTLGAAVAKFGDKYYATLAEAIAASTPETGWGGEVTLLKDITLEGGYADASEGLRIEKSVTINGAGYTIDCGTFKKGIRIYQNGDQASNVMFKHTNIVNNNYQGRCIDTRSGKINLMFNGGVNLTAHGVNSQPLTIGGSEAMTKVTISGGTIDAGTSGYGVICFVPVTNHINVQGNAVIKGLAAFYLKEGVNNTAIKLTQSTCIGTNKNASASGAFGAVVIEGSNNAVRLEHSGAVVKAVAGDGAEMAPQAAFLFRGSNNTVGYYNNAEPQVITEGGQSYFVMANANVTGTKFVKNSVEMVPEAATRGYQFMTIEDALRFADGGSTVKLLADVTLSETYVNNKTLTIDLNGKTLSTALADGSTTNHLYAIHNYGELTITDSSDAKDGKISARGIFNYGAMTLTSGTINAIDGNGGYGVRNYAGATFTMNGGTIATTLEDDNKVDKGGYDASPVRVDEDATFTMNGGVINNICDFTVAIDNYGTTIINNGKATTVHTTLANSGTMTINGGEFTCNGLEGVTAHVLWATDGSTTTINGGTFDGKDNYNGFNVDASKGANVVIKGGNFRSVHSGSLYGDGTITVSGGTFFDKISDQRCELGFQPVVNTEGSYDVKRTYKREAYTIEDGQMTEFVNEKDIEVGTLTYKRTFRNTGAWQTLYVPFEIPVNELIDNGYSVAYVNDVQALDRDEDGDVEPTEMMVEYVYLKNGILKANHPYVIKPLNDAAKNMELVLNDAKLHGTSAENQTAIDISTAYVKFDFKGTLSKTPADELGSNVFSLNNSGSWQKLGSTVNLGAFRVYFTMENKSGSPIIIPEGAEIRSRVVGEKDEATGIITPIVEGDVRVNDGAIYDLNGRPVRTPQKGKIYIMNGKKVLF